MTAVSLVGVDRAAVTADAAARRKSDSCASRQRSCDLQILRDKRVTAVLVDRAAVTCRCCQTKSDSCVSRQGPLVKAALIAAGERVTAVAVDSGQRTAVRRQL